MGNSYYVYGHFIGETCYYIGCGAEGRPFDFNSRSDAWLNIFEKEKPTVIVFNVRRTKKKSYELEQSYIKHFRKMGNPLVNQETYSYWADKTFSDEHKEKISEALRNLKRAPEWGKAISKGKKGKPNGLKGREMPLEHRQKIAEARRNNPLVKESGQKTWETRRANGTASGFTTAKAKPVECVDTGKVYRCAAEAASTLGLSDKHIQACCVGRRNTHGKLKWRYTE